jgi:predicted kinase
MKRAIVTIGPQYAGKSTFCQSLLKSHPEIRYISRDQMLIEMFGTVWLDSYTGGHCAAWERMWRTVENECKAGSATILLDAWNGGTSERRDIANKLKSFGVSRTVGWYFVTPLKQCMAWREMRDPYVANNPGSKWSEIGKSVRDSGYKAHYELFHGQKIQREAVFDRVERIDPTKTAAVDVLERM